MSLGTIFFLTGMITEVAGFGTSTLSMSLLPLLIPLNTAVPLVALISVIATGYVAYRLKVPKILDHLSPIFIGSIFGIPLGIVFFNLVGNRPLSILLGCFLIFASLLHLIGNQTASVINKIPNFLMGLIAGFFGSSININGPLIGVHTSSNEFSKEKNKDLITTYMFITGLFTVAGHTFMGNINQEVLFYLLFALPSLFAGLFLGKLVFKHVKIELLETIIYLFVFLAGIKLLF